MFPSIYFFSIAANVLRKLDFPDPSPENTKLPNHTDCRHLKFFSFVSFHSCFYIVNRIDFTGVFIFYSSSLLSPQTYFSQPEYFFHHVFAYQTFFSPKNYFNYQRSFYPILPTEYFPLQSMFPSCIFIIVGIFPM